MPYGKFLVQSVLGIHVCVEVPHGEKENKKLRNKHNIIGLKIIGLSFWVK